MSCETRRWNCRRANQDKVLVHEDVGAAHRQRTARGCRATRPRGLGVDDLHAWSDLSSRMQAVPSLKAYGLSMKGDMLWAQGDVTAARDAYQKASNIQPTPWTDKKLEAVKMDEVRQVH